MWKKIGCGCLGALVLIMGLVAVVAVAGNRPSTAQATPTAPQKPVATAMVGRTGQRMESAGIALTVNGATRSDALGTLFKAKPERTFAVVDVTLENTTRDKAPHNPVYFKVKDATGYEYAAQLAGPDNYLKSGELGTGEMVRGTVAFDVPTRATGLVLSYQPVVLLGGYQILRVALD